MLKHLNWMIYLRAHDIAKVSIAKYISGKFRDWQRELKIYHWSFSEFSRERRNEKERIVPNFFRR
jgi:hypothetical protein